MKILVLSHNTPYPPNKGDKIRAYHMIRGLAQSHEVHLLSLSKDPGDLRHLERLREFCTSVKIFPLHRLLSKLFALFCLCSPFPLTFGFFYSPGLKRELRSVLSRQRFDLVLAFCSSSAQYVQTLKGTPVVVDFVDIDSAKWAEYASFKGFPGSLIYRLEFRRLRDWERRIHRHSRLSLLTTRRERLRLLEIAGERADAIAVIPNGIDLSYYQCQAQSTQPIVVFTGQMDYLPNIDAVIYFWINVWPLIVAELPSAQFNIIGRNPPEGLKAACPGAFISGEVEDVRVYLGEARVFVAPLRMSFGSQYKVLEAMASGIPVVATSNVVEGLQAVAGRDLLVADEPQLFAEQVLRILRDDSLARDVSACGLRYVSEYHDWNTIGQALNDLLCRVADGEREAKSAQPAR